LSDLEESWKKQKHTCHSTKLEIYSVCNEKGDNKKQFAQQKDEEIKFSSITHNLDTKKVCIVLNTTISNRICRSQRNLTYQHRNMQVARCGLGNNSSQFLFYTNLPNSQEGAIV